MRQLTLELLPQTPPRLDNFVTGSNGEVITGLAAWLDSTNTESSLFFWGDSGAGKTHLLKATGGIYADAQADPDLSFLGENPEETCALHTVDNVDALSAKGQIALFNLFNRQRSNGKRLLTAAKTPPQQLKLREDVRTRLGSGLIYRLQALTDHEKIEALSAQAEARGLRLPSDALDYLLSRAPRDMRSLSALITALDQYSLEHKRAITLPLLREVLQVPDIHSNY